MVRQTSLEDCHKIIKELKSALEEIADGDMSVLLMCENCRDVIVYNGHAEVAKIAKDALEVLGR